MSYFAELVREHQWTHQILHTHEAYVRWLETHRMLTRAICGQLLTTPTEPSSSTASNQCEPSRARPASAHR